MYAAPAGGLDVWITESGCDGPGEASTPLPAVLNDSFRLAYYKGYVGAAVEAARGGVPIKGYFAWSLLDNFEWAGEGEKRESGVVTVACARFLNPASHFLSLISHFFHRGLHFSLRHHVRGLPEPGAAPQSVGAVAGGAV